MTTKLLRRDRVDVTLPIPFTTKSRRVVVVSKASLLRQRPFDVASWRRQPQRQLTRYDRVVLSVDPASGDSESWCGLVVLGILGDDAHIIAVQEAKLRYVLLRASAVSLCAEYAVTDVVIEDTSVGVALASDLRLLLSSDAIIWPTTPLGSKLERAHRVAVAQRHLVIDEAAEQSTCIGLQQLSQFPASSRDDVTDAMSQALAFCYPDEVADFIFAEVVYEVTVDGQRRGVVWKESSKVWRWVAHRRNVTGGVFCVGHEVTRDYAVASVAQ